MGALERLNEENQQEPDRTANPRPEPGETVERTSTGPHGTIEDQLERRYEPLHEAKVAWQYLSIAAEAIQRVGDVATAKELARQVYKLVLALKLAKLEPILVELFNSEKILQPTWDALSCALAEKSPEEIEAVLAPFETTKYWPEILIDAGSRLARLLWNELDMNLRLEEAIRNTTREAAEITHPGQPKPNAAPPSSLPWAGSRTPPALSPEAKPVRGSRGSRYVPSPPRGWEYLTKACKNLGIAKATGNRLVRKLPAEEKRLDESTANMWQVKVEPFMRLARMRMLLPAGDVERSRDGDETETRR